MKIALVGGTGNIGGSIANEATARGHRVAAIVRHPDRVPVREGLVAHKGNLDDPATVAPFLVGQDVLAMAVPFADLNGPAVLEMVRNSGVPRFVVVGGAGSLRAPGGGRVIDSPGFPEAWKPEASAASAFLDLLRAEPTLDWTFLSPAALIGPGERTGMFRLGEDDLILDAAGESRISQADYAVAFVDELENPRHARRRFTVSY